MPRLIYSDVTPEQLAFCLAKGWPSGGIISSEAGAVFGSHGMSEDSVMRNLSQLNQLWDGGSLSIDRRTSESFTVNDARLTVALQVQEPTIRKFFQRAGDIARGSSFMARFLIAWPDSTQGFREWVEPVEMLAYGTYIKRLSDILNTDIDLDMHGGLQPTTVIFTPAAKQRWVTFYNEIERSLKPTGELADIKDIASKAADNIARLAALFQYFEDGKPSEINEENVTNAGRLVVWHLSESRRFFNELSLPRTLVDSVRLDRWLVLYCKENHTHTVGKNYARQYSPIRDSEKLTAAITELVNLDRVRIEKAGRKITILVNPELLK